MIIGIGIDLCDTERMRSMVDRYGDRFLRRLFTDEELRRCRNRRRLHECLAGRFAAKEAAVKALGTGLSHGIAWRDVELVGGEAQRPSIQFHRAARRVADYLRVETVHVSITHDGGAAAAVVVLESRNP